MEQRLTFVALTGERSADGHLMGTYLCSCGRTATVQCSRVTNGYTRSCGCLNTEALDRTTHGQRHSAEYRSWSAMRTRCLNPHSKDYPRWGGRGITICSRWDRFEDFLADMGPRPKGTTLDRYPDQNGNYEPGNCRWATPAEQARNRKDLTVVRTPSGTMPLVDYAKLIGISKGAAHLRLKRGKLNGVCHV